MLQEIVTYLIVGTAIALAAQKIWLNVRRKWRKRAIKSPNKITPQPHENCSDCSAECMLRDSAKSLGQATPNGCPTRDETSERF